MGGHKKTKKPSPSTPTTVDGKDRISNLPEDILCHILSFLRTEEACRTSILSKQWKSLWNTLPDASFQFCYKLSPQPHWHASFVRFVNKVLGSRKPPHKGGTGLGIRKFKLLLFAPSFPPHQFITWIHHAIKCHARALDIQVRFVPPAPGDNNIVDLFLPLRLFTSEKLTTLKLHGNLSLTPPPPSSSSSSSPWLPSLKVLDLSLDFQYCDEFVPSLLSGCPVLEELHVSGTYCAMEIRAPKLNKLCAKLQCGWSAQLEIDAPSLEYLSLSDSHPTNYVIKNLDSVMEARLSVEVYRGDRECLFDLFRGLSNVKSLHLSFVNKKSALDWLFDEVDLAGNLSDPHHHSLPEFPNLVRLHFDESSDWDLLPSFLQKSPKLEVLVIEKRCQADASWTKPKEVLHCHPIFIQRNF